MVIREIEVADVDLYRAHRMEMLRDSPDAFLTTSKEYALRPREIESRRLRDNTQSADVYFIGAFEAGALLGSMGLVRQLRPKRRHIATVFAVYVTPSARGSGLAGQLLDTLISYAEQQMLGVDMLQLGVTSGNQPAVALYKSRGFSRYGTEPKALKDGDRFIDEDLMAKEIIRTNIE